MVYELQNAGRNSKMFTNIQDGRNRDWELQRIKGKSVLTEERGRETQTEIRKRAIERKKERQTDRQTDRLTDRQTE